MKFLLPLLMFCKNLFFKSTPRQTAQIERLRLLKIIDHRLIISHQDITIDRYEHTHDSGFNTYTFMFFSPCSV